MKIGLVTSAALAAMMLTSTLAAAQTPGKTAPPAPAPGAAAAPTTTITKEYVEQRVDGGQVVTFPGDDLPGDASDPYMGLVRRPPQVMRALLIRPRMNFVSELLKSCENL